MINLSLHLDDNDYLEDMETAIKTSVDDQGDLAIHLTEQFLDRRESMTIYLSWKLAESLRDQLTKLLDNRGAFRDELGKALEGK